MQALQTELDVVARLACRRGRQSLRHPEHERAPSLAAIADAVGISRFHFHRVFKEVLGTTPGDYFKAVRCHRLAQGLASGRPVTETIYDAGYGSISRAYESARKVLGMTPAARRAGGAGIPVRFTVVEQGTRQVLVAATGEGVCAIEFGDDPAELEARLRRDLRTAPIERLDAEITTWVASAASRAELPAPALELPPEVRDVAIRARLRSFLGQGSSERTMPGSVSPGSHPRSGCRPHRERWEPSRRADPGRPRARPH